MKNLIITAICLSFLFTACTENEIPQDTNQTNTTQNDLNSLIPVDESIKLKVDEKYTNDTYDFSLTLSSIEDSRCPEGTQCIWQGYARIELILEEGNDKKTIVLHSINQTVEGTPLSNEAYVGNYYFELENVMPYPQSEADWEEIDEKEVTVFVKR